MTDYAKQLKQNGILTSSDGVLVELVYKKLYSQALVAIQDAIEKREAEIIFLRGLDQDFYHHEIAAEPINERSV